MWLLWVVSVCVCVCAVLSAHDHLMSKEEVPEVRWLKLKLYGAAGYWSYITCRALAHAARGWGWKFGAPFVDALIEHKALPFAPGLASCLDPQAPVAFDPPLEDALGAAAVLEQHLDLCTAQLSVRAGLEAHVYRALLAARPAALLLHERVDGCA